MSQVWKCYRCNLYFQNEAHAHMHKSVMNHSVTRVRLAVA